MFLFIAHCFSNCTFFMHVPFLCTLHHIPFTYIKNHQYLSKLFILNLFITHAQSVPYALKGIESVSDPPCKDNNALFLYGTCKLC